MPGMVKTVNLYDLFEHSYWKQFQRRRKLFPKQIFKQALLVWVSDVALPTNINFYILVCFPTLQDNVIVGIQVFAHSGENM